MPGGILDGGILSQWGRLIRANDALAAVTIDQLGSGTLLDLQDSGVSVVTVGQNGALTLIGSGGLTLNDNVSLGFGTANGEGTIKSNGTDILWVVPGTADIMLGRTGAPSPDSLLHLWEETAGVATAREGTMLALESNRIGTNTYISFITPASGDGSRGIVWGEPGDDQRAIFVYQRDSDTFKWAVASAVQQFWLSDGVLGFQKNFAIRRSSVAGVAANLTFDIPIAAGGAANAVVQFPFQLDTVTEAGLLGETDGSGSYTQGKTIWKVPYRDSGTNVTAPTNPTTAATWLGGLRVEAGDDTNRIYLYANAAWHYINQTAGLSITKEERFSLELGRGWEIGDFAVVRMHKAYGDGGADFLPYPLDKSLRESLLKLLDTDREFRQQVKEKLYA